MLRAIALVVLVGACGSPPALPTATTVPRPSPSTPAASSSTAPPADDAPAPALPSDEPLPTYVPPPDAPYRPANPPAPAQVQGPTPEDEKACAARGGKIQPVCMLGSLECVIRYRDAGKRCTDKSQCTGDCLYEGRQPAPPGATGTCQRTSDPCGCRARVVGGKVQPTICGD